MKTRRPSANRLLSILLALFALVLLSACNNDDDDNDDSSNNGDMSTVSVTEALEGSTEPRPVTILVVDDFSPTFAPLTGALARQELIEEVLEEVRNVEYQGDGALDQMQGIFVDWKSQARDILAETMVAVVAAESVEDSNCIFNPEGQGLYSVEGVGLYSVEGVGGASVTPHGERVLLQLEELINNYASGADIRVERIPTDGFASGVIAERINERITSIMREEPDMQFVVNMSFALVPCTVVPDIAAYQALLNALDPEIEEDFAHMQLLFQALLAGDTFSSQLNGGDSMDRFVTDTCVEELAAGEGRNVCNMDAENRNQIVFVASSGNGVISTTDGNRVGQDFPFFPAAWPEVVSISASPDNADFIAATPSRDSYSNTAAVLMPGIWRNPNSGEAERGTSFAAPRYSFAIAMELANASLDICGTGAPIVPPLVDDWTINPPSNSPPDVPLCP